VLTSVARQPLPWHVYLVSGQEGLDWHEESGHRNVSGGQSALLQLSVSPNEIAVRGTGIARINAVGKAEMLRHSVGLVCWATEAAISRKRGEREHGSARGESEVLRTRVENPQSAQSLPRGHPAEGNAPASWHIPSLATLTEPAVFVERKQVFVQTHVAPLSICAAGD
jgi:hypothetical protein